MIKPISVGQVESLLPVIQDYAFLKGKGAEWVDGMLKQLKQLLGDNHNQMLSLFQQDEIQGFCLIKLPGKISLFHVVESDEKNINELELISYVIGSFKDEAFINYDGEASENLQTYLMKHGFQQFKRQDMLLDLNQFNYSEMEVPNNYELISWDGKHTSQTIELMITATGKSVDANIYPEFKTRDGCDKFISNIINNGFGKFLPDQTMLLIHDDQIIGYCFLTQHNETVGFLPIMAVSEAYRGKNLGKILLINCLTNFKRTMKHMTMIGLSVTEQNEPAFSMYKKYGFKLHENNSSYVLNKS